MSSLYADAICVCIKYYIYLVLCVYRYTKSDSSNHDIHSAIFYVSNTISSYFFYSKWILARLKKGKTGFHSNTQIYTRVFRIRCLNGLKERGVILFACFGFQYACMLEWCDDKYRDLVSLKIYIGIIRVCSSNVY